MSTLKLAKFLSKEFLEKSLKNGFNSNEIKIEDIKILLSNSDGENYSSSIYKVEVFYKNLSKNTLEKINLILKCMKPKYQKCNSDSPPQRYNGFNKEVTMYTTILPSIQALYDNFSDFAPKYFYSEDDPDYQCLVLEDLCALGYTHIDRVKGLNEIQSKIVLQKLGMYHAGCMVLLEKKPNLFKVFEKGYLQPESYEMKIFQNIYVEGFKHVADVISKWQGYENVTKKLQSCCTNFYKKIVENLERKPNDICVCVLSDLWTNNLMVKLKENDGSVENIEFIDFQDCTVASISLDLHFFFNSSIRFDILKTKREEFLQCYYHSLSTALKKLNYGRIFKYEEILNEIERKEFFGFMVLVGEAPIQRLDQNASQNMTFETILNNPELRKRCSTVYENDEYQEFLKFTLKRLDQMGIFD